MILALLLAASNSDPTVLIIGVGNQSCATAWSPTQQQSSRDWIGGFWSATNVERGLIVGQYTDVNGIIGEVRLLCQQNPSMPLSNATVRTYDKLKAQR